MQFYNSLHAVLCNMIEYWKDDFRHGNYLIQREIEQPSGISGFCLQPLLLRGWSRGILLYLRLAWVAYQKYILAKQMSKSVIDYVFEVIISGKDMEEIALSETWFLHPRAVVAEKLWLWLRSCDCASVYRPENTTLITDRRSGAVLSRFISFRPFNTGFGLNVFKI